MKKCPICNKDSVKVIYYGMPHLLCEDDSCNCLFGFWSNITTLLPFNGIFMQYEGSYFIALFYWLKDGFKNEEI